MSNYNINIGLQSSGSVGSALKSGAKDINTLKKEASSAGDSIGKSITKGTSTASSGFTKLKSSANSSFGSIKAGASAAKNELGDLGNLITGLAGGIGLMEVAQSSWTGATTKQFNSAYLQTKMSSNAAKEYISQIQTIVAEVPGDDTFMNNLMTGAVAKQTNLTSSELKKMGIATADYLVTSQAMGKSQIETQMDLKEYFLTGNTSQLERDSILKNQLDTLKDQGTVSERINALNKALVDEGYSGLSQLDIASIKWEEIKGKFQMAATTVGEKLLPYVEDVLDFVIDLDTKTDGWSTTLAFMVGTAGLLAMALAPVVSAGVAAYNAMKLYRIEAEKSAIANAANKGPGTGGSVGKSAMGFLTGPAAALGMTGGEAAAGGGFTASAMAGIVTFGAAIGLATGHFLNLMDDWFKAGGEVSNNLWKFTKGIQGLTNPLAALFNPLQKGADLIYNIFTGDFQGAIQDVISYLKAPFGDWGMGGIFQQLSGPLTSFKDGLVDFVSNTWSDFKGAVTIVGQALNQVWIVLGPAINEIRAAFGDVGSAFGDVWSELSSAASEVGSALSEVWSPLQDAFGELWEALFPVSDASKDLAPEIKKAKPEFNLLIGGAKWLAEGIRAATPYVVTFAGYIRIGAGYIKQFADFIRDVSQGIKDFKNNITHLRIIGSLNLSLWFTMGWHWITTKLNWIRGVLNINLWASRGWSWIQRKLNQIRGSFSISSLSSRASSWVRAKVNRITGSFSLTNLGTKVYNFIKSIIPPFTWPWGPASTGSGSGGGGGGAFYGPPRGPLKDTIISTMAARSGMSSGYITSAYNNRFSGLAGFTPIADGMAAPLSYQFYYGDQKSNNEVWSSGSCNCYDGAQFLQAEAAAHFGLSTSMPNGLWNGTSIPHTWSVIGGKEFDMAAKLIRGYWHHPSGPANDFAQFMTDIGPGLEYLGYPGHLKDPLSSLKDGGNCFDMTLGLMGVASGLFGLPSKMVWGSWGGQSHVWANIGGKDYDPARYALEGTWNPPPSGPVHGGNTYIFNGPVYNWKQFKREVARANDEIY